KPGKKPAALAATNSTFGAEGKRCVSRAGTSPRWFSAAPAWSGGFRGRGGTGSRIARFTAQFRLDSHFIPMGRLRNGIDGTIILRR
ncbi:hypothetical protein, partial [Staphylococcus aureus]|uniref:hypothetical protein n=1 Tax=Staphylococcus aureus TaxID=1280 RepID=UPI0038B243B3